MSQVQQEDPIQKLSDSFRGLIDEALIVAIANDHNLQDPEGFKAAHNTLLSLSQNVVSEEATGFNPSGFVNASCEENDAARDDRSTTATSISHQTSQGHNTSSSGTDVSSSGVDASDAIPRLTSFDNDRDETKILSLQTMFTELKEYDIKHALQRSNGDFQGALDSLLHVQYLQSTGQRTKGIDGFFQDSAGSMSKKKNKKAKSKQVGIGGLAESTRRLTIADEKELKHQDEISFLADRIDMTYDQVSTIYYSKHCSSGAAAAEIVTQYHELGIRAEDDEGKAQANALKKKYDRVPDHLMSTVVQVTGTVAEFSDDIAALLNKHFIKNPWKQRLDLSYRLTPLPDGELEGLASASSSKTSSPRPKSPLSVRPGGITLPGTGLGFSQAAQRSQDHFQAKRDADAYASQLYRRGASNALYRQAAVVWTDRSREHAQHAQQMTSMAADHLVSQQSSPNSIDLHGVTVRDGQRIARQRVQAWWDGLGEFRSRKAKENNFTVITGYGRHSANGVSQLRKAVAAALLQDGWKFEVGTGSFDVTGRR